MGKTGNKNDRNSRLSEIFFDCNERKGDGFSISRIRLDTMGSQDHVKYSRQKSDLKLSSEAINKPPYRSISSFTRKKSKEIVSSKLNEGIKSKKLSYPRKNINFENLDDDVDRGDEEEGNKKGGSNKIGRKKKGSIVQVPNQ